MNCKKVEKQIISFLKRKNKEAKTNGFVVGVSGGVDSGLYSMANLYGSLVVSPISELMKSEVRELAKYLGVSQEIYDAVPTDGLWQDGRSDADQLEKE